MSSPRPACGLDAFRHDSGVTVWTGATPVSLSKNCPVVECLSHTPPVPGVAPVVAIGDQ